MRESCTSRISAGARGNSRLLPQRGRYWTKSQSLYREDGHRPLPEVSRNPEHSAALGVEEVRGSAGNRPLSIHWLYDGKAWVKGNGGDDALISGGQLILFDGGENFDTIVLPGAASNYAIALADPEHKQFPETYWLSITVAPPARSLPPSVKLSSPNSLTAPPTISVPATGRRPCGPWQIRPSVQSQWYRVSDWFRADDIDGDAITQYRFKDGGRGH